MCRLSPTNAGILWAIAACWLAACEKPFEPLEPNDDAFSIQGHLEATADTQWIRVTSIRTSLETVPGPIDAVVTLEELETGTTVIMVDSLMRFASPLLPEAGLFAHNFSTTMPIVPGRHYRLTATRSDGASASATVLIPVIEDPVMEVSFQGFSAAELLFSGTRHLAMVHTRSDILECDYPATFYGEWLQPIRLAEADGEPHLIRLEPPGIAGEPPPSPCVLGPKSVRVIASGASWPYDWRSSLREVAYPASINSVEGRGLGFLGGVQTFVFSYERCTPSPGRCTITYSQRSATLVGFALDSCTGDPLERATINLEGGTAGIRSTTSDSLGFFRYRGLDPGVPYSLALSHPDFPRHVWESLTFGESATDTLSLAMTRAGCPHPQASTASDAFRSRLAVLGVLGVLGGFA